MARGCPGTREGQQAGIRCTLTTSFQALGGFSAECTHLKCLETARNFHRAECNKSLDPPCEYQLGVQQLPLTHNTKVNFTTTLSDVPAFTMLGTPSGLAPVRDVTAAAGPALPSFALYFLGVLLSHQGSVPAVASKRHTRKPLYYSDGVQSQSHSSCGQRKTPKILHNEEALAPEVWNIWFASNKASSDFLQYQDGFGSSCSSCGHYCSPTHPCFSLQSFLPYVSRDNRPISRSNYRAV